jgi:GWxTD domain-containing protein
LKINLYYLFLLLYLSSGAAYAGGENDLETSYYTFTSAESGITSVELFFKVYNSQLQFVRADGFYQASVEAGIDIRDSGRERVEEQILCKILEAPSYQETLSQYTYHIFRFIVLLQPGRYTCHLTLIDNETGQELKRRIMLDVPDYSVERLAISSLQLSTKLDSTCIQSINHVFGFTHPELSLYYETYHIDSTIKNPVLETHYTIMNDHENIVYDISRNIPVNTLNPGFYLSFSVENLPPGVYRLRVQQNLAGSDESAFSETRFTVYQSPIDLRFRTYEEILDELRYITSKEQLRVLRSAPAEARQKALRNFWKERDPEGKTEYNILMYEFYARIARANRLFSTENKEGWKTDLGFIYILFGNPETISSYRDPSSEVNSLIWEYNSIGVKFTFISQYNAAFTLLHRNQIYTSYLP